MDKYKRIKGFADILEDNSRIFTKMEDKAKEIFALYNYNEIRIPILEYTELFKRSIGDVTDVVQKEMFTFPDRKNRMLTLRPEATAGIMRAFIEAGWDNFDKIYKLYTIGPMFRYERPQKGRMRQFHQINCECLGSESPYLDAEIICMLMNFLEKLKINNLKLKLNSLGCKKCRPQYLDKLKSYLLSQNKESFCDDCKNRILVNPLRVLDCKNDNCRLLIKNAPKFIDHICDDCKQHFQKVIRILTEQNIMYVIDNYLVRGLDYYCRTTFEVVSDEIGAQTAVAGGGRYDGLIAQLGGKDVAGIGFACGMERLAILLPEIMLKQLDFYFICCDNEYKDNAFNMVQQLRKNGISGEFNFSEASIKSLMRSASRSNAKYCILYGSNEEKSGSITVKNLQNGEQSAMPMQSFISDFTDKICN